MKSKLICRGFIALLILGASILIASSVIKHRNSNQYTGEVTVIERCSIPWNGMTDRGLVVEENGERITIPNSMISDTREIPGYLVKVKMINGYFYYTPEHYRTQRLNF